MATEDFPEYAWEARHEEELQSLREDNVRLSLAARVLMRKYLAVRDKLGLNRRSLRICLDAGDLTDDEGVAIDWLEGQA